MKLFILVGVLAACATANPIDDWVSFKQTHGKRYSDPSEELHRMNIFLTNKQMIDEHNKNYEKGLVNYTMKMNHFGDLTTEEFKNLMNKYQKPEARKLVGSTFVEPENGAVPDSIDWREKGAVTPVKNQGHCGSCWAFSTTGSLEGQHFRKTGKLVSLSEQNLMDCSVGYENHGCKGGMMDYAFDYIKDNGGIDTEESYPYEAKNGECRFKKSSVGATIRGYVDVPSKEKSLKSAVGTAGPVSVAICAGHDSFKFYGGGFYEDDECKCSCDELDHGVLAVGYGNDDGKDYWLVKNSWGALWGEQGYIKIARNKNNHCGISCIASYPKV